MTQLKDNGVSLSNSAHEKNIQNTLDQKEIRMFHIKNKDCVSYQLNKRTLDILQPFWSSASSWLTIGDYNGLEANYLLNKGLKVTASDISDAFLQEANKEGLVTDHKSINVEHIDYQDASFDYVMCREAFHHFPRAYLGLYEMIRTAKKAAIIVEPIDILAKMPILLLAKNVMDWFNPNLINKFWKNRFSFETVGNYVFKISEREIEKMGMGIGLRCIAFKRINIILNLKENLLEVPMNQAVWKKAMRRIGLLNFLCKIKLIPYNTLACIVFKEYPEADTIRKMKEMNYTIMDLPKNPYL